MNSLWEKPRKNSPALGRIVLALGFALAIFAFQPQGAEAANWYNVNWGYRKKITIDTSKVAGSATSFPVLVSRTDPDWKHTAWGGRVGSATGWDFVVTDADGTTKLDHEIEKYASSTGEFVSWARLPFLSTTTTNVLYLYYGNSAASDQQNKTGVWNADFKAVWHLSSTSGPTVVLLESTANGSNLTKEGGESSPTATSSGKINGAQVFDGIDDRASNSNGVAGIDTTNYTQELWVYVPTTLTERDVPFAISNAVPGTIWRNIDVQLPVSSGFRIRAALSTSGTSGNWDTNSDFSLNTWHHVVVVMNTSSISNDPVIYVDGVSQSITEVTTPTVSFSSGFDSVNIGEAEDRLLDFEGRADEARISNILRSSTWIQTEYNNQSSPSTFMSFAPEEPGRGLQVSSRSDALSDSRPSATSNHTFSFVVNNAIYGSSVSGSSTLTMALDSLFTIPAGMDCGDVDAATSSQFNFNYPGCAATATAWGFSAVGSIITLVPPSDSATHVATGTQITIKIGSNATVGQQGDSWITNPLTGGTYTISVGGTFGGSGNMLVAILSGLTVEAQVAETLSVSISGSTIQFVQGNGFFDDTSSSSISLAFSSPVQAGNLIAVACGRRTAGTITGVTDSLGNTYTAIGSAITQNTEIVQLFYAKNITGGSDTVRCGFSDASINKAIFMHEYAGADTSSPLDVWAYGSGNGTAMDSGATTTKFANEVLFAFGYCFQTCTTAGTNFTQRVLVSGNMTEDRVVTATSSYSATMTQSPSADWLLLMATFKAAVQCNADDGASVTIANTTATTVPFGTISANTFYQGCQDISVSTNAAGGYVATVQESGPMQTASGATIPDTNCDSGCDAITAGTWTNVANTGFGHTCRNQTGNDCNAEYANGTKFRKFPSVSGGTAGLAVKVTTGSFTGNGAARTILHGLGTAPKVVMVWRDQNSVDHGWVLRTNQHTGSTSINFPTGSRNSRLASDMITGLDSSTFSLGTASSVNASASSYQWIAYAGTGVATGAYDGNGVDNRNIPHGLGAMPKMLFVWQDTDNNTDGICTRTERYTGDLAYCFQLGTLAGTRGPDAIQAMDGTNFQVGTDSHVNSSGVAYKWFALVGPSVQTGSYTGDGQDNRDITHNLSATPSAVFVWRDVGSIQGVTIRSNQYSGDVAMELAQGTSDNFRIPNDIQDMTATSFEVGTDNSVNLTSSSYQWFAVKSSSAQSEVAGETLMASSTPAIATGRVKYRLSVGSGQAAGTYRTTITYIVTSTY